MRIRTIFLDIEYAEEELVGGDSKILLRVCLRKFNLVLRTAKEEGYVLSTVIGQSCVA